MLKIKIFLILIVFPLIIFARTIDVNLFTGKGITTMVITPVEGDITIVGDNLVPQVLSNGNILYLNLFANFIRLRSKENFIGDFKMLSIVSSTDEGLIRVKPLFPELASRTYDGTLTLKAKKHSIQLINTVDIEKYIAAVVESEGGSNAENEYYKSQAVLCRTYAIRHFQKHSDEGYNLCDDVHCQAYKGRCLQNDIIDATFLTRELVIVDTSNVPINAAFHSNSGGETANSEDVWLQALPYLRAVDDPFSLKQNNSFWKYSISIEEWKKYLEQKGFSLEHVSHAKLKYNQLHRKSHYSVNGKSIPLRIIRNDHHLKSTFFNISIEKDQLVFNGKGYGHGVGLSQEGAMQMAEEGSDFIQIIDFYYKEVNLVNYSELEISDLFEN